jgi:beta-aspartyl-peptidase (threonine type)
LATFALAIHGGAGALSPTRVPGERLAEMRRDLARALDLGLELLEQGGSALDAVVAAVAVLEDSPVFNAGRGAVLRSDGSVCLDASVMTGVDRRAGAVCLVRGTRNPVRLAQAVLKRGREVLLAGADADRFALELGLETCANDALITDYRREQLARLKEREGMALDHDVAVPSTKVVGDEGQTVGAVALDAHGHLAAATSTGGMTNAAPGRVGDSPIIGAGTWASDGTVAVSATGSGEFFIRAAFAHDVHSRMTWRGVDLAVATREALDVVVGLGGRGGCVAVDRMGRVALPFTTDAMPRAFQAAGGARHVYVLEPMSTTSG